MSSTGLRPFWLALTAAAIAATASLAAASPKPHAQAAKAASCHAPADLASIGHGLDRTARRLAAGDPITIVALGSSSTAGAGASSPDRSYPSQLAFALRKLFPGRPIAVLNRGVNGDEDGDMLARLEHDVLAEKPDLVLWQVGTNSVLRDRDLGPAAAAIRKGLARIKATGADVVRMDPQFAPEVIAKAEIGPMNSLIAALAREDDAGLFRRYAVMQNWRQASGIPFETFISPDHLHMNDWGYGCVARILANAIADTVSRPILTAKAAAR
jgi:acyl-CoA thioesterase I